MRISCAFQFVQTRKDNILPLHATGSKKEIRKNALHLHACQRALPRERMKFAMMAVDG
jgi:hypothetical protein